MTTQIVHQLFINNVNDYEGSDYKVIAKSSAFIVSPDRIPHKWQVQLIWNPEDPEFYGVAVALVEHPQLQISMKFNCKVFGERGELLHVGGTGKESASCTFEEVKICGFSLIDRKKYTIPEISRISFTIDLFRNL